VRENLLRGKRAIALVGVCGSTYDYTSDPPKRICGAYTDEGSTLGELRKYNGENGHFVVITGLSIMPDQPGGWSLGSMTDPKGKMWQWVRIYDPFDDWTEYPLAETFHSWLAGEFTWMW
jgi:hypothetical protein